MTEPYDPLKDVVSDGFVDLSTATKPAPIASVYTGKLWPTFWRDVGIVAVVVSVIMGLLYLAYLRSKPALVDTTKPAIAVTGNPVTPPIKMATAKTAIKKQAAQPINTPAIVEFNPEIATSAAAPEIAAKPAQQPATRGPERPLPPSPPFPPLPPN